MIKDITLNKIDSKMVEDLNKPFFPEEFYQATNQLKPLASPCQDGLPVYFYQTYWDIIRKEITKTILNVINHKRDPKYFNHTYICFIPKTKNHTTTIMLKPIALCFVLMKITLKLQPIG